MGTVLSEAQFSPVVAVFPCQVQWGDCDPAGIIFYPTYFRWMDSACWAMFAAAGYDAKRMRAESLAMPLVSADCQFLYPAEQGDRCAVHSRILHFGGKSFVVAHEVMREDGMALAKGSETRVWGKFESGPGSRLRGQTISDELKARFRAT
ncbi:MAG TPA: acyl-CoA thioesterase [Burkholderiales bacterium]|nr:acyl-CoA thioesterase [Burkholderiales bacterium]